MRNLAYRNKEIRTELLNGKISNLRYYNHFVLRQKKFWRFYFSFIV